MEAKIAAQANPKGLSERVLYEILRTPALKEMLLLLMKDINADTAPGLVKTALWADAGISMSLFGAFPDMMNWLLELLLEIGRQLNGLPEPLLKDILGKVGSGIDQERLKQFPEVYSQLAKRLLIGDDGTAEDAQALATQALNAALTGADRLTARLDDNREEIARVFASGLDELDFVCLGKILNSFLGLGNAVRRSRRVPFTSRLGSILSQVEAGELFSMLGGLLKNFVAAVWTLLTWGLRSIRGTKPAQGSK
jgi:hypothetical protein